jgi:hypothetical protein
MDHESWLSHVRLCPTLSAPPQPPQAQGEQLGRVVCDPGLLQCECVRMYRPNVWSACGGDACMT